MAHPSHHWHAFGWLMAGCPRATRADQAGVLAQLEATFGLSPDRSYEDNRAAFNRAAMESAFEAAATCTKAGGHVLSFVAPPRSVVNLALRKEWLESALPWIQTDPDRKDYEWDKFVRQSFGDNDDMSRKCVRGGIWGMGYLRLLAQVVRGRVRTRADAQGRLEVLGVPNSSVVRLISDVALAFDGAAEEMAACLPWLTLEERALHSFATLTELEAPNVRSGYYAAAWEYPEWFVGDDGSALKSIEGSSPNPFIAAGPLVLASAISGMPLMVNHADGWLGGVLAADCRQSLQLDNLASHREFIDSYLDRIACLGEDGRIVETAISVHEQQGLRKYLPEHPKWTTYLSAIERSGPEYLKAAVQVVEEARHRDGPVDLGTHDWLADSK